MLRKVAGILVVVVVGVIAVFAYDVCPKPTPRFLRDTVSKAPPAPLGGAADSFRLDPKNYAIAHAGICPGREAYDTTGAMGHGIDTASVTILLRNFYCQGFIPEYHDEQRFRVGVREYSWVGYGFASPWTGSYTNHTPFDAAYLNVAIVDVLYGTGPVGPAFQHLNLGAGHNCVYLFHQHRFLLPARWRAAIAPPDADGDCAESPWSGGSSDAPTGVRYLDVAEEDPSANPDDYPPVLRFQESKHGVAGGPLTFIGVRCGNKWCQIGGNSGMVAGSTFLDATGITIPAGSSRWNVRGWFDDQHVGLPNPDATYRIRPDSAVSFIPVDSLASIDGGYEAGWRHVAFAVFPYEVPTKYAGRGFHRGLNKVWLRHKGATPTDGWVGIVSDDTPTAEAIGFPVIRRDHTIWGIPPIGTARYRWRDTDEEFWIECKYGCCLIEMM